jgi:predicted DNA binding CopG/RHH family protein
MTTIDLEEQELIESVENGEWYPIHDVANEIKKAQQYAQNTFAQTEDIHIQLYQRDLNVLQIKALQEGISYQSLISSIVHKYLTGQLVEV